MSNELKVSYSDIVLEKLRSENVLKDGIVFNNDYDGDAAAGAVRVPKRDTEVLVGDYNTETGIALGTSTTEYVTVYVNKDVAVNEIIDGYEAEAVPDSIVAERLDSAGYSLARKLDTDGGAELISNGTAYNTASLTKDNIYSSVVALRTLMSKANVPLGGRYLLVTPDTYALLLTCDEFIRASQLGDLVVQSGAVGRIAGFTVYEWNDNTACLAMIAGHPKYATRVRAWKKDVYLADLNNDSAFVGASAVKGRLVYTHKVMRPEAVRVCYSPASVSLLATALSGDDAGKYKITASATAGGTLKYKVITDGVLSPYGTGTDGFSSFTSNSTKIAAASGNIIEIAEFDSDSRLIASGHYAVE